MPTSISIDASVAVKAIVDEPSSHKARSVIAANDLIILPAHAFAEIAEIIFRKHLAGLIDEDQVRVALTKLPEILVLVPLDSIMLEAFAIAKELRHSIYDCLYVAAARKHRVNLITADLNMLRKIRGTQFSTFVFSLDSCAVLP